MIHFKLKGGGPHPTEDQDPIQKDKKRAWADYRDGHPLAGVCRVWKSAWIKLFGSCSQEALTNELATNEDSRKKFDAGCSSYIDLQVKKLQEFARSLDCMVDEAPDEETQAQQEADKAAREPRNSDLRDSGSIEQDADVIIFPYRPEVHDPETVNKGLARIMKTKVRDGEVGDVCLKFEMGHFYPTNLIMQEPVKEEKPMRRKF